MKLFVLFLSVALGGGRDRSKRFFGSMLSPAGAQELNGVFGPTQFDSFVDFFENLKAEAPHA